MTVVWAFWGELGRLRSCHRDFGGLGGSVRSPGDHGGGGWGVG